MSFTTKSVSVTAVQQACEVWGKSSRRGRCQSLHGQSVDMCFNGPTKHIKNFSSAIDQAHAVIVYAHASSLQQCSPFVEKKMVALSVPKSARGAVRGALVNMSTSCLPDFSIGAWSNGPQGMSRLLPPIVGTYMYRMCYHEHTQRVRDKFGIPDFIWLPRMHAYYDHPSPGCAGRNCRTTSPQRRRRGR